MYQESEHVTICRNCGTDISLTCPCGGTAGTDSAEHVYTGHAVHYCGGRDGACYYHKSLRNGDGREVFGPLPLSTPARVFIGLTPECLKHLTIGGTGRVALYNAPLKCVWTDPEAPVAQPDNEGWYATVHTDAELEYHYRGRTDEGWSEEWWHVYTDCDGRIIMECANDGADCDGRHSSGSKSVWSSKARQWVESRKFYRDHAAEAAGY